MGRWVFSSFCWLWESYYKHSCSRLFWVFPFFFVKYLRVWLLDPKIGVHLNLLRTAKLFSKVTFYKAWSFNFSIPLQLGVSLWFEPLGWCEMLSYCGCNFDLSHWTSFHVLNSHFYFFFVKQLLKSFAYFSLRCFFLFIKLQEFFINSGSKTFLKYTYCIYSPPFFCF